MRDGKMGSNEGGGVAFILTGATAAAYYFGVWPFAPNIHIEPRLVI